MKALSVLKYVGFGILGAGLMVGVIFGVQALWNWLIPELFHGPELNFWQTVGIFFLSKILLTGIAPGPQHNQRKDWKRKCRQKYSQVPKEDLDAAATQQV
jgi:hypothetical protein